VTLFGVELVAGDGQDLARFLILGGLAVLIVSMAKGGFGGSIGLLSVPIMIYAVGDKTSLATGLFLPILIATDYMNMIVWWRQWRWRVVAKLLPGAVIGVAVAWAALHAMGYGDGASEATAGRKQMADALMKLTIGVICLAFVTIRAIQALRSKPMAFRPVMWQSTAAGLTAGATSTFAHAAGPVTAMYLLPQQLGKNAYVATTVFYYWIGNQIKLAPYISLGLISRKSLLMGLVLVPAVPVGVVLGKYLSKRVNEKTFSAIVYTLLGLAGIDMCRKAIMYLVG
jgi:uncharacterized protein